MKNNISIKKIAKNDFRVDKLENEEEQDKFLDKQLEHFLKNELSRAMDIAKVDENLSVKKVNVPESEEDQIIFLEQQMNSFLENEIPKIINNVNDKSESSSTTNIITFYQLIEDCQINLSEDDILDLLQIENRWPYKYFQDTEDPRSESLSSMYGYDTPIQVITIPNSVERTKFYTRDGKFIFDEWKKYYDLGFTTMISNVLDLTPELRKLRDKLFELSGINFNGNFYLTNDNITNIPKSSWLPHKHHYNVIVKMIYGNTKWKISNDVFEYSEGDVILIPPETYHSVVECPNKRLSLTINLF